MTAGEFRAELAAEADTQMLISRARTIAAEVGQIHGWGAWGIAFNLVMRSQLPDDDVRAVIEAIFSPATGTR